jgi:uncharacterized damage-inducible protein DinB
MRETTRIIDELERAVAGDPWHGPSVHAALEGVDVTIATARPAADVHTICELVLHMTAWTREVARRLRTGVAEDPADGDWPPCTITTASQWDAALEAFDVANAELREAVAALDDSKLDDRLGERRDPALGSGVSRYVTLHGLAQHHAYHAGQISVVKRMVSGRR